MAPALETALLCVFFVPTFLLMMLQCIEPRTHARWRA